MACRSVPVNAAFRRISSFHRPAAVVLSLSAAAAAVADGAVAQSAGPATPPAETLPGATMAPRPPLIEGSPRPGVVIINGVEVSTDDVLPPPTDPRATGTPEDPTAVDEEPVGDGTIGLDDAIRPGPPRPLRAGEYYVTDVEIRYGRDQVSRAGLLSETAMGLAPVRVAMRGDRLVAPSDELETIQTTVAELVNQSPIWQRSVLPIIEAAIEDYLLLEADLFASVRVRPPSRTQDRDATTGPSSLVRIDALVEVGPFEVEEMLIEYALDHPEHPALEPLLNEPIELGVITTPDGVRHWMGPATRRESETVRLREIGAGDVSELYGGALREIVRGIRDRLADQGLIGVYVIVDPRQVTVDGLADRRTLDDTSLRVLVYTGIVKEIRTLGFGQRIEDEDSRNHPLHRTIIERSPIQVWNPDAAPPADQAAPPQGDPNRPALGSGAAPAASGTPRPGLAASAAGLSAAGDPDDDAPPAAGGDGNAELEDADDVELAPESPRRDLILRSQLTGYLNRLNRFPGRRVDAALSPADGGGAVLDFLVAERRPLLLYAQVSNTGTAETDEWRYRMGFNRTQLTGNDDILSFEYVTAGFSESHAVNASYEAPLGDFDLWRWRVGASWSEFTASDVGFAAEQFTGDSWALFGEISRNIAQFDDVFIDLYAGIRYQAISVQNQIVQIDGETQLLLPNLGARLEHSGRTRSTNAFIQLEFNLSDIAGTGDDDLNRLGRLFVDDEWATLQWGITHSFFLEPVLNRRAWEDLTTRGSSTLAHEILLSFRGQYAFGARLIPQAEQVAGGMFSVRGYPESIVAGDDVFIATAEYRLHVPRAFGFSDEPGELFGQPFRWTPQEPYGQADWDLVTKAFVDAASTGISDALFFESDEDLLGAGVGLELAYRKNLTLRMDWGFVLSGLESRGVESGDNRLHFSATLLF